MVKNKWLPLRLLAAVVGLASFNIYSVGADLTETESSALAAKILQHSQQPEDTVLTETGAKDLNIIRAKRDGDIRLIDQVGRTKTKFGTETLKHLLVNPLRDASKIKSRQNFLRKLKTNNELLSSINTSLDLIKAHEQNLFKFWSETHKLGADFLGLTTQLIGANNSKFVTELTRAGAFAGIGILGVLGTLGSLWEGSKLAGFLYGKVNGISSVSYGKGNSHSVNYRLEDGLLLGLSLGLFGLVRYRLIPAYKNQSQVTAQMLELLSSVNAILRASASLSEELELINEASALSYVQNFKIYTETFEGLSKEVTSLIKQLQTSTFENNESMLKFAGRIRVAYKKFNELKDSFQGLFRAIGELDAYASFVRLMKEHEDKPTKFCFVDYIDPIVKDEYLLPIVEFKNAWCTTIGRDTIVTQTLNLGYKDPSKSEELYCPNVYLTAANGAGKSTLLILTAHNTILSQVAGIAAASSWRTTLFDSVITHANIDHNTKDGQSAYAVEQEVMDKVKVDIMRKFSNKKVVLAVIDEPYKSTAAQLGSKLLTSFIEEIQFYPSSVCLIASHLLDPAEKIERENKGRFINLCIPTRETEPGSTVFVRDHKIKPGIDEWLKGVDEARNLRYDRWLKYTKLDKNA